LTIWSREQWTHLAGLRRSLVQLSTSRISLCLTLRDGILVILRVAIGLAVKTVDHKSFYLVFPLLFPYLVKKWCCRFDYFYLHFILGQQKYWKRMVTFFKIIDFPHYVSFFWKCGRNVNTESVMIVVSDYNPKIMLRVWTKIMKTIVHFHKMISYCVKVITVARSNDTIRRRRITHKPVGDGGLN
jgi:hypothetical protein